jgi:hypothetical protein
MEKNVERRGVWGCALFCVSIGCRDVFATCCQVSLPQAPDVLFVIPSQMIEIALGLVAMASPSRQGDDVGLA